MGNARKISRPVVDEVVARKVAKATALAKHLGAKGYEYVTPPIDLRRKAKPVLRPKFNPIEAAESHLKTLSSGFKFWLLEDMDKLRSAVKEYENAETDKAAFHNLSRCVHTIKGNAPILGCDSAGMIACPLTDLMEGCSEHKKARPILALAINAICQAIEQNTPANDPALGETIAMLNQLNSQCVAAKTALKKPKKKTAQAAGKANCSSCTPLASQSCPGTCSKPSSSNI
ncbi:MAG: Hpt domain-containing protein [Devosiaceae bacterium]|nr:Hpt domain-containing protein [Devosiaceae bacterium]